MHQHAYDQNMINFTYKLVWGEIWSKISMSWSWDPKFSTKPTRKNGMVSGLPPIRSRWDLGRSHSYGKWMKWHFLPSHSNEMGGTPDSIIFPLRNSHPIPRRKFVYLISMFVMSKKKTHIVVDELFRKFVIEKNRRTADKKINIDERIKLKLKNLRMFFVTLSAENRILKKNILMNEKK